MRTRRAVTVALLVSLTAIAAACGGDSSEPTPSTLANGSKFVEDDPCSLLSKAQVGKVFGQPVEVDSTNSGSPLTTDCAYTVGDPAAPVGRLVSNIVFPAIGAGEGADALSVVEGDRAVAQIAGPGVFDLGFETPGFLESGRSLVEFFVTPKLAVSLQWSPTGAPPEGAPVTEEVETGLTTLARDITTRLG
jgi:hypothetical protein